MRRTFEKYYDIYAEHVTGGGIARAALPPGLLLEADLMVRSLIDDLSTCPGVYFCSRSIW